MTASAGDKVVDALRAAGNARARVYRISPGGHHLYLESPDTFNDKVLHELRQTFGAERVNTAQPAHVSSGQKASAVPPGATLGFADVERSGDTQPDALDVAATLE
ncbi:hypothetical protein EON67_11675 [archaeon]|nr:MAG: hypothetical protein EON67_11675 [archaeon]